MSSQNLSSESRLSVKGQRSNVSVKGFTLLELLIVITIISVLSVILIVALNPAETLKKARDTQRLSDLASLKTAIGIYVTSKTSPQLDGTSGTANALCQTTAGTYDAADKMWYSAVVTDDFVDGGVAVPVTGAAESAGTAGKIDGTGWVKINLGSISGGSPISNLPIDPVNDPVQPIFAPAGSTSTGTASTAAALTNSALTYRFSCGPNVTFEISAQLESVAFTSVTNGEDKRRKDGGNSLTMYEVGTDLLIQGALSDF